MSWIARLRQTARQLSRRPTFALLAILTLAGGIGSVTAMYSVVRAVLLEPLPFPRAHELVVLDSRSTSGFLASVSIPDFRDWRARQRTFREVGGSAGFGLTLFGQGPAEVLRAQGIIGGFFETLGFQTTLGRLIPAPETEVGAEAVAVLGHGFWQRRFGGDPGIIGQTLLLDQRPFTVVGVLEPGAGWPSPETELYFPMGASANLPFDDRESGFGTEAIARLAPAVTTAMASEDLVRVGAEVEAMVGKPVSRPELRTFQEYYLGDVDSHLWILLAGVGCVLLIGIVNVASLQLTRGEDRRHELAVRTALGATRRTLVTDLLLESVLLSAGGGVLGLAMAWAGVRALIPYLPEGVPAMIAARIGVDLPVLLFAGTVTLVTGVVFGLLPALFASRVRPAAEVQRSRGAPAAHTRFRTVLVAAEVALALVLLIGAGLLVRSFEALRTVDKGFGAEQILSARIRFPGERYNERGNWVAFADGLRDRLRATPGVRDAAISLLIPLSGRSWERRAIPEGIPLEDADVHSYLYGVVSPEYFDLLQVPLLQGRGFTGEDHTDATLVTVIDERMAETFWPGVSPLGRQVTLGEMGQGEDGGHGPVYRTVVGVTRNVRHYELAAPSRMQAYIPYTQALGVYGSSFYALVQTSVPPDDLAGPLRSVVASLDPDVPVTNLQPLGEYVNRELGSSLAMGRLFSAFGLAALLLAGLGIFGVVSYSVVRRTREIGIRMALGADAQRVIRGVLRSALHAVLVGTAVGLVAAFLLSRFLQSLLFGVSAVDPVTYTAFAGLLLLVAAGAALAPARQATRVDPAVVLRE